MPTPLEAALDKALAVPAAHVTERVAQLRAQRPWATTTELADTAAARFRREAGLASGAVGASAALPSVGTLAATGLTVAQAATFLGSAVVYVLTLAELHGVRVTDPDRRRALVLSSLLGPEGAEAVQGQLGLSSVVWATQLLTQMPLPTVRSINKELTARLVKRQAARAGALGLGRLVPFGIGATIGWFGGRALAKQVIDGATAALVPAQPALGTTHGEVIDVASTNQA